MSLINVISDTPLTKLHRACIAGIVRIYIIHVIFRGYDFFCMLFSFY
jgi:hypothetical protein